MPSFVVDPIRIFEIKGEVCTLTSTQGNYAAGSSAMVAGVSGKRHRIMGWKLGGSAVGFPTVSFISSGATVITPAFVVPNNAAGLTDFLPIVESGYGETLTGEGLSIVVGVANVNALVFYITYTP